RRGPPCAMPICERIVMESFPHGGAGAKTNLSYVIALSSEQALVFFADLNTQVHGLLRFDRPRRFGAVLDSAHVGYADELAAAPARTIHVAASGRLWQLDGGGRVLVSAPQPFAITGLAAGADGTAVAYSSSAAVALTTGSTRAERLRIDAPSS